MDSHVCVPLVEFGSFLLSIVNIRSRISIMLGSGLMDKLEMCRWVVK